MSFPYWLDSFFIFPFRILPNAHISMWLGTGLLAFYSLLLGEVTSGILFVLGSKHYHSLHNKMVQAHNQSVKALHAGDKKSFLAINTMAHDAFGKYFFSYACLGMASLWPAPFALAWLALRFEGIHVATLGSKSLGYAFVFIVSYILLRVIFSKVKKYLPFFSRINTLHEKMKEKSGEMKRMFAIENE